MRSTRLLFCTVVLCSFSLAGCGPGDDSGTEDGVQKETGGKGDAWDWRNDPTRFRTELNYLWEELPTEGASDKVAWADTYWPTYEDSINARWQGPDTLSPAEKYDRAFNDWEPPEGFMDLRPYDSSTCEWDDAYYDALGPAARWVSENKGNWRSHNGRDDDGDGVADADECGYGEDKDRDGVETWWGLCHAWVPAAILEHEPIRPVERDGVTFEVADLKALLVGQYDRTEAYMLGGRCNDSEVGRDDTGRIEDSQCRDVNAGSFHVIVTNFLGLRSRPIAEDRTYDYEVWNQPVVGYEITEQQELTLDEVNELLNVDADPDEEAQPTTPEEVAGVVQVANDLSTDELATSVGLRTEEASAIVEARNGPDGTAGTDDDVVFADLADLEEVFNLGPRAFARMLTYAREQGWAPEVEPSIYSYNEDAERFVRVQMTLDYITESHASTEPNSDHIERYTRSDHYDYIIEIDAAGEVIGGEWIGSSIQRHPDFLWLPVRPQSGNPNVDLSLVQELVRASRAEETTELEFSSEETVEIPDNDPDGASSWIEIEDEGAIESLKLDVNIRHTYRGDLLVALEKEGDQRVVVFDGYEVDNRWEDDVILEGEDVVGFEGVGLQGRWRLWVVDSLNADTGTIESWRMIARR